jgi:hypothetical protein
MPDDVTLSKLLSQLHLLEVWTTYFVKLKAGHAAVHLASPLGSLDTLSSPWEEVPSLDSLRKASMTFPTPKHLKMDNMLGAKHVPSMERTCGSPLQDIFPLVTEDTKEMQSSKVEQALWKIFSDWNKIKTNFKSLYLELNETAWSETKYQNSVNLVMGKMQEAIKDTDNHALLLQASLGVPVDDPKGARCPFGKLSLV